MAAITKANRIASVIPPGMEVNDRAYAEVDLVAGDLILISPTAPPSQVYEHAVIKASGSDAHGVALVDCNAGGLAEYTLCNELDGYSGLTPGQPLSIASGQFDSIAPAAGVTVKARAVTTTRIRVLMV